MEYFIINTPKNIALNVVRRDKYGDKFGNELCV